VAVIKKLKSSSLQALTVAALALPGLMAPIACEATEDDEVDFQYSHYEEGKRQLYNVPNTSLHPIAVDSLLGHAKAMLSDRIKFAFNYTQDTWSGATPITTSPLAAGGNRPIQVTNAAGNNLTVGASPIINTQVLLSDKLVPLQVDTLGNVLGQNAQPVHVMSTASPETRKQGDFKLGYEWDRSALDVGGGISIENDYESRFGNLNGRWDFNQKQTTLTSGVSYTNSDTSAVLDHEATPYIANTNLPDIPNTPFAGQIVNTGNGFKTLYANRQDWSSHLGLTQVINKHALLETSLSFTHSTGYMNNPYKAMTVIFVDPNQQPGLSNNNVTTLTGDVKALLEQRPNERNQVSLNAHYIQYINFSDAALHLNYNYFQDDWGIKAHTFETDWVQPIAKTWTVTPRVRYYSQTAANFYSPYLISNQAYHSFDPNTGQLLYFDYKQLPSSFSSDQRLSGFGTLSGGISVDKKFTNAISVQAGFEYYTHAGSLMLGGSGENSYADFNYYVANAALKINLSELNRGRGHTPSIAHFQHVDEEEQNSSSGTTPPSQPVEHNHQHARAPAGVMFDHMLTKSHDMMVGYRFMYSRDTGNTLNGTQGVSDQAIVNNGCAGTNGCISTPTYMDMSMHMIDIMYAPTDWLNLMVMPQFMDMKMNMRQLDGAPAPEPGEHVHLGNIATGGVGDTGLYALFKLFDKPSGHHVHLTMGLSAPTGDVGLLMRRMHRSDEGLVHYGMQLGSGTWDLRPSLTYTGHQNNWSWGAQISGTKRLEAKNSSGYALGDIFQSTAWGSYSLTHWLSASLRGVYTEQASISGQYNPLPGNVDGNLVANVNPDSSTMDHPSNYGGRFWDAGVGLNVAIPSGQWAGNNFGVEWLQPVATDVNGYQLDRTGLLSATWSLAF